MAGISMSIIIIITGDSQSASNVLDPGHIYMWVSPKLCSCKSTFSIWSQLWCGCSVQKLHSLKGSQWVDSGHLKSLVMSKEAEPSCMDEQRQLRWGTGSESNGNIGNMIWIHRMIAGRYYQCYLPRLLSRFTIMHTVVFLMSTSHMVTYPGSWREAT